MWLKEDDPDMLTYYINIGSYHYKKNAFEKAIE